MNRNIGTAALLVALLLFLFAASFAQEPPDSAQMAEMMKLYEELAKPGPEHKLLEPLVGKWESEIKFAPAPGVPPMAGKMSGESKWILGGRFLMMSNSGMLGDKKTESTGILGFDRRTKKYTWIGLDTEGTYYVTAAGTYDSTQKALVLYGEEPDPIAGFTMKYDLIIRILDKNKNTAEVIFKNPEMTGGAPELKVVESVSKRVK